MTNGLRTCLYKKETDCNGYIPYDSGHHRKWLNNIPRGRFGRIKRNCSDPKDFQENCEIMKKDFIERGYSLELIQDSIKRVDEIDRETLLAPKKEKNDVRCVPFVMKFSTGGYKLTNMLKKHWQILPMDADLQKIVGEHPSLIFTRPNTLKQSSAPSFLKRKKLIDLARK
ncbi:hypothetical protein XELAEV_18008043mg [Xenopus laevis]|uniref:Helix-turn-helix domain-containing protein n=1 Tax=Xenopus laevis TaxID=8355 RepID=A0A974E3H0_XENLA|nr:hypothetical protein XELAEV_18008043mg [Xenopus laevis]